MNEYGKLVEQLTNNSVYDAEGTLNAQGDKIVFTSLRTGDPELYTMNLDGSGVVQVHFEFEYASTPLSDPLCRLRMLWATMVERFSVPTDKSSFFAHLDQKHRRKLKNTKIS